MLKAAIIVFFTMARGYDRLSDQMLISMSLNSMERLSLSFIGPARKNLLELVESGLQAMIIMIHNADTPTPSR